MKRIYTLAGVVFLFMFVSESAANILGDQIRYGQIGDGIKVGEGRTVVHPTYEQRGTFDSNIFLDPTSGKCDYFFDFMPGVEIEAPFSKHLLKAGYNVDFAEYCRYNTQNSNDQHMFTNLLFDFDRYYLRQDNYFNDTTTRSGTEFTDKVERRNWTFDVTAGASFDRLTFENGYSFFFERYVKDIYQDLNRYEHIYTSSAFYRIFPKTEALLEYNYGNVTYETNAGGYRDNDYNQIRAGARGMITQKLSGIGKIGWMGKTYPAPGQHDFSTMTAFFGFTEKFTESTTFTISYERTAEESTWLNNNYYLLDLVTFRADQQLMTKLAGWFSFSYGRNSYPNENTVFNQVNEGRADNLWTIDVELDYSIIREWLKAGLQYEFANRTSDFAIYDYDRHQVIAKLDFKF